MCGEPIATERREAVSDRVRELRELGVVPTLGTVLMSDDPADMRFMDLKHAACDDVGIAGRDIRIDPAAPAGDLLHAVDCLCTDSSVDAVFVQVPLPDHVSTSAVRRRLDPAKDVDCFHYGNLGRLVAGDPRFVPATTAAVCLLLRAHDVPIAGREVAIVGRSPVIARPLANRLLGDDATVTVCGPDTRDLGSATRRADVVVTACGVPELVDGSMLAPGAVVVDAGANSTDGTSKVVGDVAFESAKRTASAITPVPGSVGPVTIAALLENVVRAAERQGRGEIGQ